MDFLQTCLDVLIVIAEIAGIIVVWIIGMVIYGLCTDYMRKHLYP